MAIASITLGYPAGTKLFQDTAQSSAAAVAVAVAGVTIYEIEIDNTMNAAQANYVKFFNSAGAIIVGTTIPDMVIMIPAAVKRSIVFPEGIAFGTGLAIDTTTAGGTAGAGAPGAALTVRVVYA